MFVTKQLLSIGNRKPPIILPATVYRPSPWEYQQGVLGLSGTEGLLPPGEVRHRSSRQQGTVQRTRRAGALSLPHVARVIVSATYCACAGAKAFSPRRAVLGLLVCGEPRTPVSVPQDGESISRIWATSARGGRSPCPNASVGSVSRGSGVGWCWILGSAVVGLPLPAWP